jgi:hypothetical protein
MRYMKKIGIVGDQLKKELQVVIGSITYFQNKGAVYSKTWEKMKFHMDRAIELYNEMKKDLG